MINNCGTSEPSTINASFWLDWLTIFLHQPYELIGPSCIQRFAERNGSAVARESVEGEGRMRNSNKVFKSPALTAPSPYQNSLTGCVPIQANEHPALYALYCSVQRDRFIFNCGFFGAF